MAEPSINNIHASGVWLSISSEGGVSFKMKSVSTWDFIVIPEIYRISNSPSPSNHLNNQLEMLTQERTYLNGWLMITCTTCAYK